MNDMNDMKFAIVSPINIQHIVHILNMFDYDIDNNKPDYVVTYGGDGTILLSERKYPGIPKVTLRASEGGTKCIYSEYELEDVLLKLENNDFILLEEQKLEISYNGRNYLVLNEVQLHNEIPIKAVRFSVYVNDLILFEKVIGDGVIIATPFGSTAYYSSIGGKKFNSGIGIGLNNPYNIKYEPNNIDKDSEIVIKVFRDNGLLLFDNDDKMIKLKDEDEVKIKTAKYPAKFVVVND